MAKLSDYPILRWFHHEHLPPHLAEVSKPFCDLAIHMADTLPRNAETSAGLRHLLEAKDCAVRSAAEPGTIPPPPKELEP